MIDAKRIVREIKLLKFFDHENIIKVLDVAKPPARTGFEDIYIITELIETDMHRVIYSRQDLTDDHLQYFMHQLLKGCYYMHSSNIIHRDLKFQNVMLAEPPEYVNGQLNIQSVELKVVDFGMVKSFDRATPNADIELTSKIGRAHV